jgi:putative nucleotidyltransferase with HDIG domain
MNLKMAILQAKEPLASVEENTRATIKTLFQLLEAQGQGDYLGEQVTQLEHSLQCAHLATQSPEHGTDFEVILAALLHDVGRFIPAAENIEKMITPDGHYIGRQSHEALGETYLRELGFSEKVCKLVGAHVMAKRYLVATDKSYYDGLSETSKRTLEFQVCDLVLLRLQYINNNQGGGYNADQVREAQHDSLLEAKLAVRRWDDLAKKPNCKVPPLEAYEELAYQCLIGECFIDDQQINRH